MSISTKKQEPRSGVQYNRVLFGKYYMAQGMVPLEPSCALAQMKRVCSTFFKFALQVSLNKIYQPSVQDSSFSCNMNISRNMYNTPFAADDSVRLWLTNYAESHLHDPSKGHTIILSVPSRKIVYEAYENDFKHRPFFYFPPTER